MAPTCSSCGAEHAPGARFCSSCGAPLQRTCPSCGAEQPASAAFCSSCGIALQEEARPAGVATDDRRERRVVTVLFADLAGSTALGELLDPEEVSLALPTGEPQRIVPMANVAAPLLLVTGKEDELRTLTEEVVAVLDATWPSVLTTVPLARALAAAGETELLKRLADSLRRTPSESIAAMLELAIAAAEGLLQLESRPQDAAELLRGVSARLHELGHDYEAACLDLDLARALQAAGADRAAAETRARCEAVLEPLGCVHPF